MQTGLCLWYLYATKSVFLETRPNYDNPSPGLEDIKLFHTQLPTKIVGILTFISRIITTYECLMQKKSIFEYMYFSFQFHAARLSMIKVL